MWDELFIILLPIVGPFIVVILLVGLVLSWYRRGSHRIVEQLRAGRRCPCGYDLSGLEVPRCSECGRARGFDCTLDELGLSEKDVIAHRRARKAELESKPLSEQVKQALDEIK